MFWLNADVEYDYLDWVAVSLSARDGGSPVLCGFALFVVAAPSDFCSCGLIPIVPR
jgi:hypothetical protein